MSSEEKILLIINKNSGTGNKPDVPDIVASHTEMAGRSFKTYTISGDNDSAQINQEIKSYKPSLVVASGGDGTVNLVGQLLIGKKIRMGIIPTGSANGMAYELGIPTDVIKAVDLLFTGKPIKIDAVKINNSSTSFHLCDIGLNARIVKSFEEEGGRGMMGYAKHLFKEIFSPEISFTMNFNTPSKNIKTKAIMAVIANSTSYGTGAKINPTGNLSDGKFELVILKPHPPWFVFKMLVTMFRGTLHLQRYIKVYPLEEVKISLSEPHELQVDGEVLGLHKLVEAQIIPKALEVIVP